MQTTNEYNGKWVSKSDSEENGIIVLDVIVTEGSEVKAVGRNLSLNDLLMNYKRYDAKELGIPDPFMLNALPSDVIEPEDFEEQQNEIKQGIDLQKANNSTFIDNSRLNQNNEVFIYQPKQDEFDSHKITIDEKPLSIASDFDVQKSSYSVAEDAILNLIDISTKKKKEKTRITISLDVNLDFNIHRFKNGAQMLGLEESDINSGLSIYLQTLLNADKLKELLISAIENNAIDSKDLPNDIITGHIIHDGNLLTRITNDKTNL